MLISFTYIQQDTTHIKVIPRYDSVNTKRGLTSDTVKHKFAIVSKSIPPDNSDTAAVCTRNSVADVTFYDRDNFIYTIGKKPFKQFPYIFTEKVRQQELRDMIAMKSHLKNGIDLPPQPLHTDWMIVVLFVSAFLFSLVKRSTGRLSDNLTRFFLFRGVTENNSREAGGLFYWQSTVLNFISFLIIGLFGYSAAAYYNLIPDGIKGILVWLIAFGIISLAVTLRHITCVITGAASGEHEIFREYLLAIYQSYRFAALFLSAIVILISYTRILHINDLIISGLVIVSMVYLIRVVRLLIIFLNRNISIFYLILYLCALEILPVLIIVKYFTGLV